MDSEKLKNNSKKPRMTRKDRIATYLVKSHNDNTELLFSDLLSENKKLRSELEQERIKSMTFKKELEEFRAALLNDRHHNMSMQMDWGNNEYVEDIESSSSQLEKHE